MKNEKITKKTSNIIIRENSARRRDSDAIKVELPKPELPRTDPLLKTETSAMRRTKKCDPKSLELQKELIQAENLDENELRQISEEATRMMARKVKDM